MKKTISTLFILGALLAFTACGKKAEESTEASSDANQGNPLANISEKDVVSEEDVEIGGEEMTNKTLKDGTKITLPKGMTIDEAKKMQEDGNIGVTASSVTKDE